MTATAITLVATIWLAVQIQDGDEVPWEKMGMTMITIMTTMGRVLERQCQHRKAKSSVREESLVPMPMRRCQSRRRIRKCGDLENRTFGPFTSLPTPSPRKEEKGRKIETGRANKRDGENTPLLNDLTLFLLSPRQFLKQ